MTDVELLAYCGWQEDRGEGVGACYGVMHVVMNRVRSEAFPNTIHGVIYQPNAFSWTRPSNPEHGLQPSPTDAVWAACLHDAPYVIVGDDDPTGGALYYANLDTIDKVGWFQRNVVERPDVHPVTVKILHHTFFK